MQTAESNNAGLTGKIEVVKQKETVSTIQVDNFSLPFDPKVDKLFCSFCGKQCVETGHMVSTFLLCPDHGEFTIAPIVIKKESGWFIEFRSKTMMEMWKTCQRLKEIWK